MNFDLHVHTAYSDDSNMRIGQLLRWCSVQSNLDGIAITDHDTIEGYLRIRKLRTEEIPLIIPGIEISFTHGHVLILNVLEEPKRPMITIEGIVDYAKDQGGLIILAHPYRFNGLGDLSESFPTDAVEILNPTASNEENRLAKLLANSRKLPGVAGSDAHNIDKVGEVLNHIEASNSIEEVIKSIKNGNVTTISQYFQG
jgi:predicted metal-dependent phosphoesterase TrpH